MDNAVTFLDALENEHRYYYLRQKLSELVQNSSYLLPQFRGRKSPKVEELRKQIREYLTQLLTIAEGNRNRQMCWARCKGMYFCDFPAHHKGPHSHDGFRWEGKYDDGQAAAIRKAGEAVRKGGSDVPR